MSQPDAPPPIIRGCTCFRLRRLTRRVTQHYDTHLARAGLRVTQYSLLGMLLRADSLTLSELAARMEMDRTTLTRNLGPLQNAGWVEVVRGKDARSRAVQLTDAGRAAWDKAKPHWRQAQDQLNTALGEETVAELHGLLDGTLARFHLALDEAPAAAAGG
ncbi:MarR family winged helix-turn-helix transcriptional regulator [Nevskia soli]|uniref:MarR family winged helix-turn-helix transcriptional regulator n=1 Tax=Nevskia soli TaxID=418856 RepID=UPI00055A2BD2|nr:MarR family winged helix-turn-helix transcriptional regulator [Nevskia soli]